MADDAVIICRDSDEWASLFKRVSDIAYKAAYKSAHEVDQIWLEMERAKNNADMTKMIRDHQYTESLLRWEQGRGEECEAQLEECRDVCHKSTKFYTSILELKIAMLERQLFECTTFCLCPEESPEELHVKDQIVAHNHLAAHVH